MSLPSHERVGSSTRLHAACWMTLFEQLTDSCRRPITFTRELLVRIQRRVCVACHCSPPQFLVMWFLFFCDWKLHPSIKERQRENERVGDLLFSRSASDHDVTTCVSLLGGSVLCGPSTAMSMCVPVAFWF